jgi:hypothetical protein
MGYGTPIPAREFAISLAETASQWRQNKPYTLWPWRELINSGRASTEYLKGIVLENYFYVHAAVHRQCVAAAGYMPVESYHAFRRFLADEVEHDQLFRNALLAWGMTDTEIDKRTPLIGTQLFIDHQRSVAALGVEFYAASTCVTEVNPALYARLGGPYDHWAELYSIPSDVTDLLNRHLADDLDGDHGMLVNKVLAPFEVFSAETAARLVRSMRATFEAMWMWQRNMYEHYELRAPLPATTSVRFSQ